jgi:hypothetical protein
MLFRATQNTDISRLTRKDLLSGPAGGQITQLHCSAFDAIFFYIKILQIQKYGK